MFRVAGLLGEKEFVTRSFKDAETAKLRRDFFLSGEHPATRAWIEKYEFGRWSTYSFI